MSAVLKAVPEIADKSEAVRQRRVGKALTNVITQINKLEGIEHEVIALLPSLSDDQVMETRNSARLLYASAWKIEIACDAEIWDRTTKAVNGRGNKDEGEKGILAAVNKRAHDLGCSGRTVYENARIHRRFKKKIETTCNILDDKGFFQAALASEDPDVAIEEFAKMRSENPFFRVADAWRWVRAAPEGPKEDETKVLATPEAQAWLSGLHTSLLSHIPTVPESAAFLKHMIQAIDGVVLHQSERTVEGDCRVIMEAIEETGGLSGDDLYDWQIAHFYFMSEDQLKARLLTMVANKELIEEDAGKAGKQAKRRGKLPQWYEPYYAKRQKYDPCKKCGEWHRDPEDCMED